MNTPKLPPLPANLLHIVRRIRACEGEIAAQVVFEHALNEYALAAIQAQGVPDGWQLVPKASTPEILDAITAATGGGYGAAYRASKAWVAALASAPPAPQAKPQPLSDEQSRELAEQHYMQSAWYDSSPVSAIGSRQWCAYWDGWRAAHGSKE